MADMNIDTLLDQALNRSERERAVLAEALISSLEKEPEMDVEKAWQDEIGRRVAELDSGATSTLPWEEVRRKLHGRD